MVFEKGFYTPQLLYHMMLRVRRLSGSGIARGWQSWLAARTGTGTSPAG